MCKLNLMKRIFTVTLIFILTAGKSFATGEPSTYFQIFVPPNGTTVQRNVAIIVTAIYDSTTFSIIDDGADGDTDDSKSGMLMAGQSYILYIGDNSVNDDARYAGAGTLSWDGDYFIVKSNKLVFASQSTNSDWQHDWVPSTDKKSIGQKYIIYSPKTSSSKNDINVFAYDDNTTITYQKISTASITTTGYTSVNFENPTTIFSKTISRGEDIIYKNSNGRDVMNPGETYVLLADKPVTVQYGALYGDERDGGGYVPSSNGSSSGSLFYFGVPYQSAGEQEIRFVAWDDSTNVTLERYDKGKWTLVNNYSLNKMQAKDWVGKNNGNVSYATTFRITTNGTKRVSVFEGNWFETGTPGTSDMATMVSSENGTSSGTKFLTYMAPPGDEQSVVDPFTKKAFGQQLTHLYIFAKDGATVTITDAYTGGTKFKKSYTIGTERYVDCYLTLTEWKNIYNGTGTTGGGPERPYLLVQSDKAVSVMNTNFNDNWMCYSGSSLTQSFTETSVATQSAAIPGDTIKITSYINTTGSKVDSAKIEVLVQDGLKVISSTFKNADSTIKITGDIKVNTDKTDITFNNVPALNPQSQYTVETKCKASASSSSGTPINGTINTTIETVVTGKVDNQIQQSVTAEVVSVNTANTSKFIFSKYNDNVVTKDSTDSWTASWVDYNNDSYDDLFVTDRRSYKANILYTNNKKGGFTKYAGSPIATDSAISVTSSWADVDNDGDLDAIVLNNTRKTNFFYKNNNGTFTRDNTPEFTKNVSYYFGGGFADFDNDNNLDLFVCNYFATKYNELYRNNGDNTFSKQQTNVIPSEANQSMGPTWADYDGDGFPDLFVPNGTGYKNSLFHNEGNGNFAKVDNAITKDGSNSVGSCWGDYDNDGDMDLFVTNANSTGNYLYRNDGKGVFTKITNQSCVTDKATSHGCSFADIDNDGDIDLYVSNDTGIKFLYLNNGNGTFTRNDDELPSLNFGNAKGHAWSDFDHDGDLDLFVATTNNELNGFYTNNGNINSWIEITLQAKVSNGSAIGAKVFVKANNIWQMREVNAQSGFGGQSSLTQHFGLGNATIIDSVKIKWPSGIVQVLTKVNPRQILNVTETQFAKITGAVFFDNNNNCIRDAGEALVARAAVNNTGTNTKVYTNDAGYFSTNVATGSYSFKVSTEKGISTSCTNATVYTIDAVKGFKDTIYAPATAVCNSTDINLIMGGTAIRKGFGTNNFTMIVTNNGRTTATSFSANFKAPTSYIIANNSIAFTKVVNTTENNINYKTYTWQIDKLDPFQSQLISFTDSVDATLGIGNSVSVNGWVDGLNSDCTTSDNAVNQSYTIVGAIDPNDIQVVPVGYGKEGFIQPSQLLTYTIRFQNNGNHAATSVHVEDVLPDGLDLATLKVISASHDGLNVSMKSNTVNFNWDNIYLSDSLTDAGNSQGYVTFSIMPGKNIKAGAVLRNSASIQFDAYQPTQTNRVLNTIQSKPQEENMIEVKTYPNPAADVLFISLVHKMGKFTNKVVRRVDLLDLGGRVVLSKTFNSADELRLNIPIVLNGMYMVRITDSENVSYSQLVMFGKRM